MSWVRLRQQVVSRSTRFLPGGLERWRLVLSRLAPTRLVADTLLRGRRRRRLYSSPRVDNRYPNGARHH